MKTTYRRALLLFCSVWLLVPEALWAAGGKAEMLVVVADTRRVSWSVTLFFLDLYNTSPVGFGILCVVLTALLGCGLGVIADFVMKRTGIDLTSRKIVEH